MVNFKIYGVTTWLTITIHIFSSISQSKCNQKMTFGQLKVYNKIIVFLFKNYAQNEAGSLVPDFFCFFKKV